MPFWVFKESSISLWVFKEMATGLRFDDRLEGDSNFSPQRARITLVLEENEIWEFFDKTQTPPTNSTQFAAHNKKDVKARRIVLDWLKDHIIP